MIDEKALARQMMRQFYEDWFAPGKPAHTGPLYWDFVNGESAWLPHVRIALEAYEAAKPLAGTSGEMVERLRRYSQYDSHPRALDMVAACDRIEALEALVAEKAGETGSRHPQFVQGMRSAQKRTVQWLHDRAASMNDPHAKSILDSAAFSYGGECKRALAKDASPIPLGEEG